MSGGGVIQLNIDGGGVPLNELRQDREDGGEDVEVFVPDETQGRLAGIGSTANAATELGTYVCHDVRPHESGELQRDS